MKKDEVDDMRPEYSLEGLGPGVRGKHLEAYRSGTNLVLLSPDVAKAFPTEKAVNDALRSLIDLAQRSLEKRDETRGQTYNALSRENKIE